MAVEWFYTANKHQMGPVSWDELKQLAESGLLKPRDMVWSEGMDEWVKAVKQQGLFTDDDEAPAPTTPKSRKRDDDKSSKPPPGKRSRTEVDDDEDDDDRKRSRRDKAKSESSKVALKVGLIIGGVILLLGALTCGGVMFFRWGSASTPEPGKAYTWSDNKNMKAGGSAQTKINFKNGQRYAVNVSANANNGGTNLDFIVTRSNGQQVARESNRGLNYQMNFTFPADDAFNVRVENRGPGVVSSYRVVFAPQQ